MGLILQVDRTCHQFGRHLGASCIGPVTTERSKQALHMWRPHSAFLYMEENLSFLSQLNCLRLQAQRDNRYTRVTFAPQHL